MSTQLTNWGNYPVLEEAEIKSASNPTEAATLAKEWEHYIPRGLGRCYGDSALSENVLSTLALDRMIDFNPETGVLTCEAGVSFESIIQTFLPRGWFLPVTPGTKFITVGGAIAADIHGKNHHSEGSWSRHLHSFRLLTPRGEILHCSKSENKEIFWATCGGMGLTGLLLDATFKLKKVETSYIVQHSQKAENLDAILKLFDENLNYTYSVAWLDVLAKGKKLGRSILYLGEDATQKDLRGTKYEKDPLKLHSSGKFFVPFYPPNFVMNNLTMKLFNIAYYHKTRKKRKTSIVHYDPYYYPLDGIHHWNRVYGKRGFVQYQFVLPPETGYEGLVKILEKISSRGFGSFLTVLKWFGDQEGLISFPKKGYTLAMDFSATPQLFPFLDELDEIVLKYGGRLYLTKDSRMDKKILTEGYEGWGEFMKIKRQVDPEGKMESLQSRRLGV